MKNKQLYPNTILFTYLFFFSFVFSLNGQTYYAVPFPGNTLKLKKKNDMIFSIGNLIERHGDIDKRTQQIQIGFVPRNHLGVSVFHSRIKNKNTKGEGYTPHNSHHTGLEIGTFYDLEINYQNSHKYSKRNLKRRSILGSLYMGYANAKLNNIYGLGQVKMNLHKYYIHAGIHWCGRRLEVSGLAKTGKVNFYKGVIDGQYFGNDLGDIGTITRNNVYTFLDYTINVEINFIEFGLYGQLTSSTIKAFNRPTVTKIDIGLVFYIGNIKKKLADIKKQKSRFR